MLKRYLVWQATGLLAFGYLMVPESAIAQISPDTSLVDPSIIDIQGELIRITGGTTAGSNLFHSFSDFSIPTNNTAFFDNPIAIENIISRVTGGRISSIDGLIRANGTANLFLINPSGIVFGPNARLDLGGSFFGSTASSINFADGTQFSAIDPQPVLTINVPIGLQYGSQTGDVQVIGSQLQVPDGSTLALFGGTVSLDNAQLLAPGGRIELGGFADGGIVGLNADGSANVPIGIPRRDIAIANTSLLNVTAGGGGQITLTGNSISLRGGSQVLAGIAANSGAPDAVAGDIQLNAIGFTLLEASTIANNVGTGATGNGGNIFADSTTFTLQNNSLLDAGTFGTGNAGSVRIQAIGDLNILDSSIFSDATLGDGDTGSIAMSTQGSIAVINSQIRSDAVDTSNSDVITEGIAGSIAVLGTSGVTISGSTLSSESNNSQEVGFSDISIGAIEGSVAITNTIISSSNLGTSFAGDILIDARDRVGIDSSRLTSDGEQGQILIGSENSVGLPSSPQHIAIANSELTTQQFGQGTAGNLVLNAADRVELTDSRLVSDAFSGSSDGEEPVSGGSAGTIEVTGINGVSLANSTLSSESDNTNVDETATLGNIAVAAPAGSADLTQTTVSTSNFGTGFAGDIILDARDRVGIASSTLTSNGEQGQIFIGRSDLETGLPASPQQLSITANSQLSTTQFAQGTAGNLVLQASDRVEIADSTLASDAFNEVSDSEEPVSGGSAGKIEVTGINGVSAANSILSSESENANTDETANLGDIRLTAVEGSVNLTQATVSTSNFGTGFAGDLIISAIEDVTVNQGSRLSSNGNFGRIAIGTFNLNAETLPLPATVLPRRIEIEGGSLLTTNNDANADAADVSPDVPLDAGNIILGATERIAIANTSSIQSSSNRLGNAGYILLQGETADISLSNSTLATSLNENGNGIGGNLVILARSLSLSDNAQIDAGTFGIGDAGDIFITSEGPVFLSGEETRIFSDVASETAQGSGGTISIEARSLSLSEGAALETGTLGEGDAGDTFIVVRDRVSLNPQSQIRSNGEASGDAGNISVEAGRLELDDAAIEASSVSGNGGNIILDVRSISRLRNGSRIATNAGTFGDSGDGGNIILDTQFLVGSENSDITANSFEGLGGFIQINSQGVFGLRSREQLTPENDITAFSQRNPELSGFVEINSPEVDTAGIVSLPENVVDVTALVGQDPCTAGKQSEFLITGRGGLPPNPSDPLVSELDTVEWVPLDPLTEGGLPSRHYSIASAPTVSSLVEATDWRRTADGSIDLVARGSRVTPVRPSLQPPQSCR